jgi:hypothetical protein
MGDGEREGVGVAVGVDVVAVGDRGISVARRVGVTVAVAVARGVLVGGGAVGVGGWAVAVGAGRVEVGDGATPHAVRIKSAKAAVTGSQRWCSRRRWRNAPEPRLLDIIICIIPWNWED